MPILFDLFRMVAAQVLVAPLSISRSVKGHRAAEDAGGVLSALDGHPLSLVTQIQSEDSRRANDYRKRSS